MVCELRKRTLSSSSILALLLQSFDNTVFITLRSAAHFEAFRDHCSFFPWLLITFSKHRILIRSLSWSQILSFSKEHNATGYCWLENSLRGGEIVLERSWMWNIFAYIISQSTYIFSWYFIRFWCLCAVNLFLLFFRPVTVDSTISRRIVSACFCIGIDCLESWSG